MRSPGLGRAAAEPGRISFVLFVYAALPGCTTFESKPFSPELLAQQFDARTFSDQGLRDLFMREAGQNPATWPVRNWNVSTLSLAAEYYSPALAVECAELQGARADIDLAGARPHPPLQLPFAYSMGRRDSGQPTLRERFSASRDCA